MSIESRSKQVKTRTRPGSKPPIYGYAHGKSSSSHVPPAKRLSIRLALLLVVISAVGSVAMIWTIHNRSSAPVLGYEIIQSYPHDPAAYTQGLVYYDGLLYESTGLYGESTLREVDLESGKVLRSRPLVPEHFGEGLTMHNDRLIQLTWRSNMGFVYALSTFQKIRIFRYEGEGWGLTHDEQHLILSDGTSTLRFLDPESFRVLRTLNVRDAGQPIHNLNELEYIDGEIWANIWQSNRIARISPRTGRVTAWIDLDNLIDRSLPEYAGAEALNGIAHDKQGNRIFVTGKNWPRLFEIRCKHS